jgi:hypothetical protein
VNEPAAADEHANVADLGARGLEEHQIASVEFGLFIDSSVTRPPRQAVLLHRAVGQVGDLLEGPASESRADKAASW